MAAPITSFDLIEGHKENIQPIRSGRSARALAASLSPLSANLHSARSEHYVRQAEFEEELKTASELDDPLEVWLRYINWTVETFPSGHSSESGLLPLLERATKEFFNDDRYRNDLRYLKLWIHYTQSFSDAPREVFVHLARNDVGQRLALFYEEWAALSETLGRKNQAAEIYQLGIDRNAQPIKRLERKFAEFHERIEAGPPPTDEPSSPVLPTIRPALAAKPFGGSGGTGGIPDIQQQPQSQASKPPKQKMTIFSDSNQPSSATPILSAATGGWENIGSLQHRKKENAQEPKPWAGETLKQQGKTPQSEKLMVFRDNAVSSVTAS
jgi:checkpoint serine/threonine-protein kinase